MSSEAGPDALPGVVGLDHIGLAVADLDAAVALHTSALGLTVAHRETNHDQGVVEVTLTPVPGGSVTQLQLVAPLHDRSTLTRFLDRHGPGLHHLAYAVADVRIASNVLARRGWRLL